MNNLRDKYQIKETSSSFTFQPFFYRKKWLKWYVLIILVLIVLTVYYSIQMYESLLIVSVTFLSIITCFFLKEWLIEIPTKLELNLHDNAIYKSGFLFYRKKIMNLDEIIIFKNSEMGIWHYKMGRKKSQFVKNFQISENFLNDKKLDIELYENEILDKIEQIITKSYSEIPTNSSGSTSIY